MKHPKSKIISLVSAISVTLIINGCATTPPHSLAQKIDQDMVLVEGGQFTMGADNPSAQKSERPARTVNVDGFYLSKFEVTQSLFEAVTGSSLSYFRDPNTPVNNISWQQANYFIKKLNEKTGEHYRLPTEAEWEFAAKGGILSKGFTFSGSNNIDDVAWYANNSHNQAHKVGQKQPNELGLYDMTGNVGEFVIDAFDEGYYKTAPSDNPVNAKEEKESLAHKSVRGGSFAYNADESENYRRDFASQSVIMSDMGLRLAKDVD
ncbi:TPA: formylglycine-generating enzyme family protein [Vibrio diabolicus]|uniref:formylglycine-generating enzyme family protein n=1 Tax=Vibrio diabolicus TaxID=50719 RepID=UPI00211AB726|nr:formylglycine-generating enzyme family protein [Vibrio diabolicus]MCG6242787.1 formylglycine-generating enzyme family protein [Vibrio diabolicus]MCR9301883.1 formylglycine-generating enzyme family protein [Vibrio diabolicus]MCR9424282.1 formylglycine-generating enzyme family protein [Vibrio diabolicus]MCS0364798.1 formylglycine-generating enzyme family protein [Vibrio diabolicus]MCS0386207.1 formylglycine-generating enzyme family protein [Vibrio diabolicus]